MVTAPLKIVQITFKLKGFSICDSFNIVYVVICDTCKDDCIGGPGEQKSKLSDSVRVYR